LPWKLEDVDDETDFFNMEKPEETTHTYDMNMRNF
jgi:NADPH-ferrihemoprotein reductase